MHTHRHMETMQVDPKGQSERPLKVPLHNPLEGILLGVSAGFSVGGDFGFRLNGVWDEGFVKGWCGGPRSWGQMRGTWEFLSQTFYKSNAFEWLSRTEMKSFPSIPIPQMTP